MQEELSGGGPHLFAAFLCERLLQEKDGVLSFIRVVDRFVRPAPNPQTPMPPVQAFIVVGMKAGSVPSGKYKVTLRIRKPDESQMAELSNEVFFEGGQDRGVVIGLPFAMVPDEEGLYWIDVYFVDRLLSRIPARVLFQSMLAVSQQPGA